ncbi:MAG: diguanylate cyclase [Proteobacteria bacterium]|nr:diguanylate cyclase [Pseudomonadota bacterium]HQR04299.1 diguanylate cyclase [Rhodocyclaceae bacterium]
MLRLGSRFRSLKTRLTVFTLLLILASIVACDLLIDHFLRGELTKLIARQQLSLAHYVAQDVETKLRARLDLIGHLAQQFPLSMLHNPDAMAAWLAERHATSPLFSGGIFLISPQGTALADAPLLPGRRGRFYGDRDYFRGARDQGVPAIGMPAMGRATRQPIIGMAAPVRTTTGEVAAVLAGIAIINTPDFLGSLQQNHIGETGGYLLVSPRDRLFVTATDPAMVLRPLPPAGTNPLLDRIVTGYRGTGTTITTAGVEELWAMTDIPVTGWVLVVRLSTAEAFRPLEHLKQQTIRYSLGFGFLLLCVVLYVLSQMFRPLAEAARQVHTMATGATPTHALPVRHKDEVGYLANGFNLLLGRLREREAALARLAHHDPLTGLPNRIAFLDRLSQSIALARRQNNRLALLFLDLDGFKPVNDDHGHETGDQVLCLVARRLLEAMRKSDVVSRFGGDEFVILLADIGNLDNACAAAQKCIDTLSVPMDIDGCRIKVGASIGIALYPEHAVDDGTALITLADAAMYDAKHGGRNTYRIAPFPT